MQEARSHDSYELPIQSVLPGTRNPRERDHHDPI
jgi:hypothetical protein